jgi:hypothetical protein
MPNFSDRAILRFSAKVHAAAQNQTLDSKHLLSCVEDSRALATGGGAVLTILQHNETVRHHSDDALSMLVVDQLLGLCRVSISLLNEKIEWTADFLGSQLKSQI